MSVGGIGAGAGIDRVMALRAQILERNQALSRVAQNGPAGPADGVAATQGQPASFADTMSQALSQVNTQQAEAGRLSDAYERGETVDIARVMLARQQAQVGFEATLQVRNRLLTAYKDIMNMPV